MTTSTWNRTTRIVVLALAALAGAWFLWFVRPMFGPLMIAGFVAYLLNPLVDMAVARTRLRRGVAATIVFFGAIGLLASVVMAVVQQPEVAAVVVELVDSLGELQGVDRQVEGALGIDLQLDELTDELQRRAEVWLNVDNLLGLLQALTANAAWTLVAMVTTYYLLKDWSRLRRWLIGLAPAPAQEDLQRLYDQVRQVWQRFLRGQLLLMLFVGLLSGLGAAAVGLPGAMVLGLMAGVLDIIPTLGPWVAMAVAAVVAWIAGSNFLALSNAAFVVVVLVVFSAVQLVENVWLRPRILGYSVRMHPGVVFVAFFTALTLSGVLLAVMIVPLLATAFVLGGYLRCRMLDIDPWGEGARPHPVGPDPELPAAQPTWTAEMDSAARPLSAKRPGNGVEDASSAAPPEMGEDTAESLAPSES